MIKVSKKDIRTTYPVYFFVNGATMTHPKKWAITELRFEKRHSLKSFFLKSSYRD